MLRKLYCQGCARFRLTATEAYETQKPCDQCGAVDFQPTPPPHQMHAYVVTEADRVFLRVQRIDPDN